MDRNIPTAIGPAIRALGKIGHPKAIRPLATLQEGLASYSDNLFEVLYALARIGTKNAIEVILHRLEKGYDKEKKEAKKCLGIIENQNGIQYMISLLKKKDFLHKNIIAESLGLKSPIVVEPSLIKFLRNEWKVKKLKDQSLLAKIVKIAANNSVRCSAVKNLTDQGLLAEIACSNEDRPVRLAALYTLSIMSTPLSTEAIKWLKKPKKEAYNDYENNYRLAIIQGIKREQWPVVLVEESIGVYDKSSTGLVPPGRYSFSLSYSRTDDFYKTYSKSNVKIDGILEPNAIYWIYSGGLAITWDPGIKLICKGDDCISVAKKDSNRHIREAAVSHMITNQGVLADIAKTDKNSYVRKGAVEKLDTEKWQDLLADIAKNDKDEWVCEESVKRLKNQYVLADIAKNNGFWRVRREAVQKLKDQEILSWVFKNDRDWEVQEAAELRLKELKKNKK